MCISTLSTNTTGSSLHEISHAAKKQQAIHRVVHCLTISKNSEKSGICETTIRRMSQLFGTFAFHSLFTSGCYGVKVYIRGMPGLTGRIGEGILSVWSFVTNRNQSTDNTTLICQAAEQTLKYMHSFDNKPTSPSYPYNPSIQWEPLGPAETRILSQIDLPVGEGVVVEQDVGIIGMLEKVQKLACNGGLSIEEGDKALFYDSIITKTLPLMAFTFMLWALSRQMREARELHAAKKQEENLIAAMNDFIECEIQDTSESIQNTQAIAVTHGG